MNIHDQPISFTRLSPRTGEIPVLHNRHNACPGADSRNNSSLPFKKAKGFTLIEVMVALTIIAISLSALLSTSGTQANSAGYLKQKTLAHWVAVNELTQIRIAQEFPDVGDKKGETTMASNDWYWIRTTKKTEDDNARQISFTIYSDKERTQNITSLIGYANRDVTITTQ